MINISTDISTDIIIGVIAGVITYALSELVATFFKRVTIPWYQSIIYQGVNIKGTWYGFDATVEDGEYIKAEESESTIILNQQGNKITGELLLTKQPNGEKCRKLFELDGVFTDNILTLKNKVRESDVMGMGTFIMKIVGGGKEFKGKHTYISANNWSTIFARDQVWIRKST
ncbi:MAG: hypothetical protein HYS78_02455 [Parcubacteria group bacterium]|nr:hypothetical protein [Parcubacteria group bacterium]